VKVAVIIPARDAAHLLPACVAAVAGQDRPPDEMWIAAAPSRDGTLAVANHLAGGSSALTVIENTVGDRASGLNLAIRRTAADVIAFVDAQSVLAPDYLATSMRVLEDKHAAVVGGPMRPVGGTAIGQAMALALQSPFGIGDSQFHFAGAAREVDSVYLGVYRKSVFDRIGLYNSQLQRTEDDDLNWRIKAAGLRIWMDPAIQSTYQCRGDLASIWGQFYGYGFWKVALATLRPSAIRMRHVVPAAFVIGLAIAVLVSALAWWPALPLLIAVYLLAAFVAAALGSGSPAARLLFPVVTATMHVAYGAGTLLGLASWMRLRRLARQGATT
jgi:GT2 family glycosyltransferase